MACCLVETRWFRVSMSVFWKAMLMSSRFRVASFWAICFSSAFSASARCVKSARSTASSRSWNGSGNPSDHGIWSSDCPVQSPVLPRPCPSAPSRTGRQRRSVRGASPSQPPSRLRSLSGGAQLRRGSRPAHPAPAASAPASAGSSSRRRSPALTASPVSTWIPAILPGSSGSMTLE
jgi:hypothetical protein